MERRASLKMDQLGNNCGLASIYIDKEKKLQHMVEEAERRRPMVKEENEALKVLAQLSPPIQTGSVVLIDGQELTLGKFDEKNLSFYTKGTGDKHTRIRPSKLKEIYSPKKEQG